MTEVASPSAEECTTHRLQLKCPAEYRVEGTIYRYTGAFDAPEDKARHDALVNALDLVIARASDEAVLAASPVKLRQFQRLLDNVFADHPSEDRIRGTEAFVFRSLKRVARRAKDRKRPKDNFLDCCPQAYQDTMEGWPLYDSCHLKGDRKIRFDKLVAATELFLAHRPSADVAAAAGLSIGQYKRLFQSAMQIDSDTQMIMGVKAFAGWISPSKRNREFGRFLIRHPQVESRMMDWLNSQHRPNSAKPHELRRHFKKVVEEEGIPKDVYPYGTDDFCRKPLWVWFKETYLPRYYGRFQEHEVGKAAADVLKYSAGDGQAMPPVGPYAVWTIDEVRLDAFIRYELPTIFGGYEQIDLQNISLILVRERTFGLVLAWRLVISEQVSAQDICLVLLDAIQGQPSVAKVLPNENYQASGGYPVNVFTQLKWCGPRKFLLDNALQHLAISVQTVLQLVYGTKPFFGRAKTPKTRADQESEFRTLAMRVVHQIPESKGSHPKDPIRAASKRGLLGRIEVAALENLLHSYFHNANGLPKATSGHLPPLVRLGRVIEKNQLGKLVSIAQIKRNPCFFSEPAVRTVKLSKDKKHIRPAHVNFGARYSSDDLRRNGLAMEGQKLTLRPNYQNLQSVLAFHTGSGGLFGTLTAEGVWGRFPHDLRIRSLYQQARRQGLLGPRADDAPMESLYQYLTEGAKADKRIATNRAYLVHYFSQHIADLDLTNFDIVTAVRKADAMCANDPDIHALSALHDTDDDGEIDEEDVDAVAYDDSGRAVASEIGKGHAAEPPSAPRSQSGPSQPARAPVQQTTARGAAPSGTGTPLSPSGLQRPAAKRQVLDVFASMNLPKTGTSR